MWTMELAGRLRRAVLTPDVMCAAVQSGRPAVAGATRVGVAR